MPDRNLWKKAGLLAATLTLAAATQAQSPVQLKEGPSSTGPDIVVKGKPEATAREVEQQARTISRMSDFYHDPLARFSDSICPGVLGLPVDAAGIVIDRIRYNAERIGAPVDPSTNCKANIIVAFTRDGGAEVDRLLKSNGYLFDGLETPEAKELRDETGPVHAWNVTALRNRHGQEEDPKLIGGGLQLSDDSGSMRLGPIRVTSAPTSDSRLFLASRVDITASVVIIDLAAIDGMPVAQIADYAAMRALARTRPAEGDTAASTILSLFDSGSQHPREMTSFDLAYLRSLYDAGSNVPASVKIFETSRMFAKDKALALKNAAPQP